jgi:hypothetical protein
LLILPHFPLVLLEPSLVLPGLIQSPLVTPNDDGICGHLENTVGKFNPGEGLERSVDGSGAVGAVGFRWKESVGGVEHAMGQ